MDAYDVLVVRFESNINRRYLPIPGLQRVFGIDQKTAEEIAQNLPRVVKRRVTLEVAAQYAEVLSEIGAEVQLRPCQDDPKLSQSTPPTDREILSQPSHTIDPETPGPQTAHSAQQPVDNSPNPISTAVDDDGLSRTSTRPSQEDEVSSQGSLTPERQAQNANRAHEVASPSDVTSNATNRSHDARSVWPHAANVAFDSNPPTRPLSTARSTSTAGQTTSQRRFAPSSSPIDTASTGEPISEEALKNSFWAPGTGFVLAGSALILIGLFFDGSIFTGNAGITDCFFDVLGLCWIAWGLFKLVKKGSGLQLG